MMMGFSLAEYGLLTVNILVIIRLELDERKKRKADQ